MSNKRCNDTNWDTSSDEENMHSRVCRKRLIESARPIPESSGGLKDTGTKRRGRGTSRRPCLNRNALMARENRQRKKAYLEKIEHKLLYYQQENKNLVHTLRKQSADVRRLSAEVTYLKSILNNNTSITALLRTINEGLFKLQCHKNGTCQPEKVVHLNPSYSDATERCTHLLNTWKKTSEPEDGSSSVIFNSNGHMAQDTVIQKESNQDDRMHVDNKCSMSKGNSVPLLESDHTYTVSKSSLDNIRSNSDCKVNENVEENTISPFYHSLNNDYINNGHSKDFHGVTLVPHLTNQFHSDEKRDMDFDQLPLFNSDIFADLPKCDEAMTMIDSFHDAPTFTNDADIFKNLDNAGICFHINSDKVSLEFCAICHMNCKNSKSD